MYQHPDDVPPIGVGAVARVRLVIIVAFSACRWPVAALTNVHGVAELQSQVRHRAISGETFRREGDAEQSFLALGPERPARVKRKTVAEDSSESSHSRRTHAADATSPVRGKHTGDRKPHSHKNASTAGALGSPDSSGVAAALEAALEESEWPTNVKKALQAAVSALNGTNTSAGHSRHKKHKHSNATKSTGPNFSNNTGVSSSSSATNTDMVTNITHAVSPATTMTKMSTTTMGMNATMNSTMATNAEESNTPTTAEVDGIATLNSTTATNAEESNTPTTAAVDGIATLNSTTATNAEESNTPTTTEVDGSASLEDMDIPPIAKTVMQIPTVWPTVQDSATNASLDVQWPNMSEITRIIQEQRADAAYVPGNIDSNGQIYLPPVVMLPPHLNESSPYVSPYVDRPLTSTVPFSQKPTPVQAIEAVAPLFGMPAVGPGA